MLSEIDDSNLVVRKYTWGLDLAGQSGGQTSGLSALQSAGGIGGLLGVYDDAEEEDYVYLYDANGNVSQVIDLDAASASAAIKAHYEYDPYGNIVNQTGAYADESPFRFSTKYFDNETGLGSPPGRRYLPHRVSTLRCTPVPKGLHNPGRMNRGPLRQPTRTACCYLSKAAASLVSQLSQCQLECDVTFRSRVR